jgi:DNA-binding MarR family transcriptional regulator
MKRDIKKQCAERVIETVPLAMRTIGSEMRKRYASMISVQQFRALSFIKFNNGASLSMVAEFTGATLPTASRLVDGLVDRRLVTRKADGEDRRRIILGLTRKGEETLQNMWGDAMEFLAGKLAMLTEKECSEITGAMETLKSALSLSKPDLEEEKV